jgi:hypothetical protein
MAAASGERSGRQNRKPRPQQNPPYRVFALQKTPRGQPENRRHHERYR